MKRAVAFAVIVPFIAGCAPTPKLLRHYETYSNQAQPAQSLTLSAFPASVQGADEVPLVLQLTERAQAELIRSTAAKVGDDGNAALMALLAEPTTSAPAACAWAKKQSLSKRLVVTLLGDLATPADRIDKLDIVLTLSKESSSRAEFTSWDRFTSKYADINIGTAKLTQSNKFTAGLGNTSTSAAADATSGIEKVFNVGYEKSNSLDESATYALKRLTVGGELTKTTATLVQEGGPNTTLFGSAIVTVSLKLKSNSGPSSVYAFGLMEKGKFLPASAVKVERCPDFYPVLQDDIVATVSGSALIRKVTAGGGTVTESDDEVVMTRERLPGGEVKLAGASDLFVERFGLAQCGPNAKYLTDCEVVQIEYDGPQVGSMERVLLPSFASAAALRTWLVDQAKSKPVTSIVNRQLAFGTFPSATRLADITSDVAGKLRVVQLTNNMAPPKPPAAAVSVAN